MRRALLIVAACVVQCMMSLEVLAEEPQASTAQVSR